MLIVIIFNEGKLTLGLQHACQIFTTQTQPQLNSKVGAMKRTLVHPPSPPPPPPTTQTQCHQYLSCSCPDFNPTLKVGLWDQQ